MKQINIREFCLRPASYLKELPITLTRYGKSIASIIPAYKDGYVDIGKKLSHSGFKVSVKPVQNLEPKPMTPIPPLEPAVAEVKTIWYGGHKYAVDEYGNETLIK